MRALPNVGNSRNGHIAKIVRNDYGKPLPTVGHLPYVYPMTTHPDLIPAAEVARIYGCHVRTVHRMVTDGRLVPAIKAPGKRGAYLFRRADVLAAAQAVAA